MNNHLYIVPKQAKLDLESSKMRWRFGFRHRPLRSLRRSSRPPNREGTPNYECLATPLTQTM